jgi:hypothetical protein
MSGPCGFDDNIICPLDNTLYVSYKHTSLYIECTGLVCVMSLLHAFVNVFEPVIPSGTLILVIEQLIAIRKPTRDFP